MGKMTTKKIEEKGIRILEDFFEDCDRVDTYISRNDKEPLWDGHLYLFNSEVQSADNVYGKIPTQVKTLSRTTTKDTTTFSVKKAALNSYKRDGGILYVLVLLNNPIGRQIYTCQLTPVAIKKYLKDPGKGDTISITLSKLPADKQRVTEDLFQFHFDCKKQTTSADKPIKELQDYFKSGKRSFTVFANTPNPIEGDDIFNHIQSHPVYMYATDEDRNITIPLGDGPVTLLPGRRIKQDITINNVPYFKGCILLQEDDEYVVAIGDFFTYRSGSRNTKGKLDIKLSGHSNFSKIAPLAFCLALFKYKNFSIGSLKMPCDGICLNKAKVQSLKTELSILSKVRKLFRVLHIEGDINLDELTQGEMSNLDAFYRGIVLKEPLELKPGKETSIRFTVGPHTIYLTFYSCGEGKYEVRDFFTDEDVFCILTENEVSTKSSRFTLLDVDNYVEASNFDYSGMIKSYEALAWDDEKVAQIANWDMLRMILAFDKTGGKKVKLLDAAEALNDWFIRSCRFAGSPINEINRLQIIKRRRAFSDTEKDALIEMSESDIPEDCKTACQLLLGNQAGAEYHFKKMTDETKIFFKTLPIYRFWKEETPETKAGHFGIDN